MTTSNTKVSETQITVERASRRERTKTHEVKEQGAALYRIAGQNSADRALFIHLTRVSVNAEGGYDDLVVRKGDAIIREQLVFNGEDSLLAKQAAKLVPGRVLGITYKRLSEANEAVPITPRNGGAPYLSLDRTLYPETASHHGWSGTMRQVTVFAGLDDPNPIEE